MVIVAEEIVSTWGTFRVVHENNDPNYPFIVDFDKLNRNIQ